MESAPPPFFHIPDEVVILIAEAQAGEVGGVHADGVTAYRNVCPQGQVVQLVGEMDGALRKHRPSAEDGDADVLVATGVNGIRIGAGGVPVGREQGVLHLQLVAAVHVQKLLHAKNIRVFHADQVHHFIACLLVVRPVVQVEQPHVPAHYGEGIVHSGGSGQAPGQLHVFTEVGNSQSHGHRAQHVYPAAHYAMEQ
ncbi:MAG: hypothetical protein IPL86_14985 [Flavobacteriales bacterium]|nr:hypothetical protein [Flavobacteriales bacterium]